MTCSEIDLSKPVQTGDGRPVQIFRTDLKGGYPVGGVITIEGSRGVEEILESWTTLGEYMIKCDSCPEDDLVNVPDRPVQHCRTLFVAARGTRVEPHLHYCPEDARKAFPGATAIIEVALDWRDGDGIEESV